MKLYYIAGHGAGDPGAVGNNYTEADLVRQFGNALKKLGGDSVKLSDYSRNYYADGGISRLNLDPNEWAIIEGHMDAGQQSARGGHVIIYQNFIPDDYDNALAAVMSKYLPGRAKTIVKRGDLANPYAAAVAGYNYRLCEFGFITNPEDVKVITTQMETLAQAVLACFGIAKAPTETKGGNGEMLCYIQRKGNDAQYLYNGFEMRGVPNLKAKAAMTSLIKNVCGYEPKTVVMTPEDFDAVKKIATGK